MLLDFIAAYVMAKIERSLFEKDCKALEPQIQKAVNERQGEIADLLKRRKPIYANVRMEVLSNFVSNQNWQNPGGDYRYFKTQFIDAAISTDNINNTGTSYLNTVVTTLWKHSPFTYSFPLGTPMMAENAPAGFQSVLDAIASALSEVSRNVSVGGPRFQEINKNLDVALRMLGKNWEIDWAKTAVMTDAERFNKLKSAVDEMIMSMHKVFGTQPAGNERQILAMLFTVKYQLEALQDLWPVSLERGTWQGANP